MKKFFLVIIISATFIRCATIKNGLRQEIEFKSDSVEVDVSVDDKFIGETPVSTKLSKITTHTARFETDNSHSNETYLKTETDYKIIQKEFLMGLIYSPFLLFGGFDFLSGGADYFIEDSLTIRDNNLKKVTSVYIKPLLPPPNTTFLQLDAGGGYSRLSVDDKMEDLFFPQIKIEYGLCIRQEIDFGIGINWKHKMQPSAKEEINLLPIYGVLKYKPFQQSSGGPYLITQLGAGLAWGRYRDEESELTFILAHLGLGIGGMGIVKDRKIYIELLWDADLFVPLPSERLGYSSFGILVGYRFEF